MNGKYKKKNKKYDRAYFLKFGLPMMLIPGLILSAKLGLPIKIEQLSNYYDISILFPKNGIVKSVTDGDTLVMNNSAVIRLTGINAPDRGDSDFDFSKQKLIELVEGKRIWVEYDSYQDDKYGRALAWVWVGCESTPEFLPANYMRNTAGQAIGLIDNPKGCSQGKLVNEEMVIDGKAISAFYEGRGKLKYQGRIENLKINN